MDPEPTTPMTDAQPEWREPFCEPQTIPAGWDTSALLFDSVADGEEASDHPAQG
jgi:hypothetical protein